MTGKSAACLCGFGGKAFIVGQENTEEACARRDDQRPPRDWSGDSVNKSEAVSVFY